MAKKRLECMDRALKKYRSKCITKTIMFYPTEEDKQLYEFSTTINFQGEVKKFLKRKMKRTKKTEQQKKDE